MFTATDITADVILNAYHQGIFPMAESIDSPYVNFYKPEMRGQLSIKDIHIPKKLMRTLKKKPYEITINTAFETIVKECANPSIKTESRETSWINPIIHDVFLELHNQGHAHSVECWHYDDNNERTLAGGLYGLAIGQIFCGESMVSLKQDASKIALINLCARLYSAGFTVLDTQFVNDHLEQFGVYEIPQAKYDELLKTEPYKSADFLLKDIPARKILKDYLEMRRTR